MSQVTYGNPTNSEVIRRGFPFPLCIIVGCGLEYQVTKYVGIYDITCFQLQRTALISNELSNLGNVTALRYTSLASLTSEYRTPL